MVRRTPSPPSARRFKEPSIDLHDAVKAQIQNILRRATSPPGANRSKEPSIGPNDAAKVQVQGIIRRTPSPPSVDRRFKEHIVRSTDPTTQPHNTIRRTPSPPNTSPRFEDPSIKPKDDPSRPPPKRLSRFLTKFLRAATKAAGEELLASYITHDRGKNGHYFTSRVPKMMVYGAFVDTTLSYFLLQGVKALFKDLDNQTSNVVKYLVSLFLMVPLRTIVHIVSIALIAGARTFDQIKETVFVAMRPVVAVVVFVVPLAMAFAHKFVSEHLWPSFFGMVTFCVNTFVNASLKKMRLRALRQKHFRGRRRRGSVGEAEVA